MWPCDVIVKSYQNTDVYGKGSILAEGCEALLNKGEEGKVEIFNKYCQTPSTNTDFLNTCSMLLADKTVIDNQLLIFNDFIQNQKLEGNSIQSAGYIIGRSTKGVTIQTRAGGKTMVYLDVLSINKPPETALYYCTFDNPNFREIPFEEKEVVGSIVGFDVDKQGVVYFHRTVKNEEVESGENQYKLTVFKFDPSLHNFAQVILTFDTVLSYSGPLSVSGNGNWVCIRVTVPNQTNIYKIDVQNKTYIDNLMQNIPVRAGIVFDGLYINDNQDVFYTPISNQNNEPFYMVDKDNNITFGSTQSSVFANRMTEDGYVYGFPGPKPGFLGGDIEQIRMGISSPIIKKVCSDGVYAVSMTLDDSGLVDGEIIHRLFVMTDITSEIIAIKSDTTQERLVNYALNQNLAFLSVRWTSFTENEEPISRLFYSSMFQNINLLRVFDIGRSYSYLDRLMLSNSPLLCDNGDIILTDDDNKITFSTGTSDGTVNTDFVQKTGGCVKISTGEHTLSLNGKYVFKTEPTELVQNIPNQSLLGTWCNNNPNSDRRAACQTVYKMYCGNMGESDPHCFCFENMDGILDTMFDLPKLNPIIRNQLTAVAPCLASTCKPFFKDENIVGEYLSTFDCPSEVVICDSTVKLSKKALFNSDFVVVAKCGTLADGCTDENCPIGSKCDNETDICLLVCEDTSECDMGYECNIDGLCRFIKKKNKISLLSIILIIITSIVFIVAVWFIVRHIRRKKGQILSSGK